MFHLELMVCAMSTYLFSALHILNRKYSYIWYFDCEHKKLSSYNSYDIHISYFVHWYKQHNNNDSEIIKWFETYLGFNKRRWKVVAVVAKREDVDDAVADADDEAQHKSCFNWSELGCRCSTERLGHKIKQHYCFTYLL